MNNIETRLRADAARWQEHLDARPLPEVAVPAGPVPRSRWLPLTAAAGVTTLVAGVALGAHLLTGRGTDPLTGVRPRPLSTATLSGGVPVTFVGIYQRGPGDLGERTKRALALLSSTDGRPVRVLAVATSNTFSTLADPSRGPDGDVWFVRAPKPCGGRIVRIDAATGRGTVVVSRPATVLGGPVASPDGRWLAFRESSCDLRDGANQLVLRDLVTGVERNVLPVDARGRLGAVPAPTRLGTRPPGKYNGANVPVPRVPAFQSAPAWSPDSSRLAVVRALDLGSTIVGAGVVVLDTATGRQVRQLAASPGCSFESAAYDGPGLAFGETCHADSNRPQSSVVQVRVDLRGVLSRHQLAPCSTDPKVTAAAHQRQALLITTSIFCPGTDSQRAQRVAVSREGRLRTVHDYVAPAEFLDGAMW